MDGKTTMYIHERKASIREFYGAWDSEEKFILIYVEVCYFYVLSSFKLFLVLI